jgi:hypothetical protein
VCRLNRREDAPCVAQSSLEVTKMGSLNDRAQFCSFWISGWVPLVAALGHQCLHIAAMALIG